MFSSSFSWDECFPEGWGWKYVDGTTVVKYYAVLGDGLVPQMGETGGVVVRSRKVDVWIVREVVVRRL